MADITAEIRQSSSDISADIDPSADRFAAELGGGSFGTKNYEVLTNKPKINGVELIGNKTPTDLGEHELSALEVINIWNSIFKEE